MNNQTAVEGQGPKQQRARASSCEQAQEPAHVRATELCVFKRSVSRSGMSADSFVQALTQTALASLITWDQVDLETLLLAAERLGLDPLGREVFLVRDEGQYASHAVVVVGVDGWSRIINTHKEFAGMRFKESQEMTDGVPTWVECSMYRWDRKVPTAVREYLAEVRSDTSAWQTHPRRMLRHKAMVQCARLAFGLVGVYDHDEAERIMTARRGAVAPSDEGPQGHGGSQGPRGQRVARSGRYKEMGVDAVKRQLGV